MERKKLLIADDSEMNRAILANMLEQDFEIMEVSDGKEALAALQIYRYAGDGRVSGAGGDEAAPVAGGCADGDDLRRDGQQLHRPGL